MGAVELLEHPDREIPCQWQEVMRQRPFCMIAMTGRRVKANLLYKSDNDSTIWAAVGGGKLKGLQYRIKYYHINSRKKWRWENMSLNIYLCLSWQGGVDNEVSLTAYITIALLEIPLPVTVCDCTLIWVSLGWHSTVQNLTQTGKSKQLLVPVI